PNPRRTATVGSHCGSRASGDARRRSEPKECQVVSTRRPSTDGRSPSYLDRGAERTLREEVREAVGRLLDERQLLTPGPGDDERAGPARPGRGRATALRRAAPARDSPAVD